MAFSLRFTPQFEKQLQKIKYKKPVLFANSKKKILQIKDFPYHHKPLKASLKGLRRAHAGSFVIIFQIYKDEVILHYIKHHDNAYS